MPARELLEWAAFERVFGPLTVQERVDVAGALAAWASVGNPKRSPRDFMPDWQSDEARTQDPEDMIAVLRGIQRKKDKPS